MKNPWEPEIGKCYGTMVFLDMYHLEIYVYDNIFIFIIFLS